MDKNRITALECLEKIGQEVSLAGFVVVTRLHGKIGFLDLRDRSGVLQIGGFTPEVIGVLSTLSPQDIVSVKGLVKKREEKYINTANTTGTIELEAREIVVLVKSAEMPFDMGGKTLNLELPTLLDNRSLTLRHGEVMDIFKVQEAIVRSFHRVAQSSGCTEIFTPTISASATEGGAEVFRVDYYDHKAYLIQSPQLYKQMLVPVFERVYTISHAYRAEPSVTTRHLAEVTQLDCEFGFADFPQLLDLLEEVIVGILSGVENMVGDILEKKGTPLVGLDKKIPRLTLREAQGVLLKETGRDSRTEPDLSPQDEIDLCKWALNLHGTELVTVTHFPTKKRSFYTMPDPKDPEFSLSYDILFRGLEISSGSQRINLYEELVQAITDRGMEVKNFGMYLQAFKYGMPIEGGFSFGLERLTMKLLGLHNVREASLYPRDMERVDERL